MTNNWRSWGWKFCSSGLAIAGAIALSMDCAYTQIPLQAGTAINYQTQIPPTDYILNLTSLTCHSTVAGGTNPDQISIYINNQLVWGPAIMSAGNVAALNSVPGTAFHKKVRVEIFAQSNRIYSGSILNTGSGSIHVMYGLGSYTLIYGIAATNSASSTHSDGLNLNYSEFVDETAPSHILAP